MQIQCNFVMSTPPTKDAHGNYTEKHKRSENFRL